MNKVLTNKSNYKHNKLTFAAMLALVIGNIIGSGIYLLPTSLAQIGTISLYGWALSVIGAIGLGIIFSVFSRKIRRSGGPYIYAKRFLGKFVGFITVYNYWLAILVGNAAVAIAFTSCISVFWPQMVSQLTTCAISVAIIWILTWLNMISVKDIGYTQLMFNILKFIPLILICLFGWAYIHKDFYLENYNVTGHSDFYAISSSLAITLWAFIGIESATIPTDLVEKPQITIPLATTIGTIVTAIIYIASSIVIMGMVDPKILRSSLSPFADAAEIMIGLKAKYFIALATALSCIGSLHGWILLQGQIAMVAAKDKLLPAIFAKENSETIPVWGLIITSGLITILIIATSYTALSKQFLNLILLATIANIVPYFFSSIAFIKLNQKLKNKKYKFFYLITALLVLAYLFLAFITVDTVILWYYLIFFITGIIFYQIRRYYDFERKKFAKN